MIKLQRIEYFVTLARTLSFTRTAEIHYVSQTAVTQQIRLLEEELGTPLFVRSSRHVALTPAGRHFYAQAVKILDLVEMSVSQIRSSDWKEVPLKIGLAGVDNTFLLGPLRSLSERIPGLTFDFRRGTYESVLKDLLSSQLDLGLSLEMFPPDDPRIERTCIRELQQYVVVSNRSRLSQYASLSRIQLDGETFLIPKTSRQTMGVLYSHFLQAGCRLVHIRAEDSLDTVLLKAAFEQGFTILSESAVNHITPDLNLALLPLDGEKIPLCLYRNAEHTNPLIDRVCAVLENRQEQTKTEQEKP